MDSNIFESEWSRADINRQLEMVSEAAVLPHEESIRVIMAGLTSFHASVKNKAREALGNLQKDIRISLTSGDRQKGLFESAILSVHVHRLINENTPIPDLKQYLGILLESGGRSPFYAWRICRSGIFSSDTLTNTVNMLTEPCRLVLVNQYLASSPSIRREYAEQFIKILRNITEQKSVIQFYSYLFDTDTPADIVLENIDPSLRDAYEIITNHVNRLEEFSHRERACALKAAAMVTPVLNPSLLLRIIQSDPSFEMRMTALRIIEKSPSSTYVRLTENIMDILCGSGSESEPDSEMNGYYGMILDRPEIPAEKRIGKLSRLSVEEAMNLFRAAVKARHIKRSNMKGVDVQLTLQGIIFRIEHELPELIPHIMEELLSFSWLALCFLEDMAEDPTGNLFCNSEVEHALICGMIRKRPERFLKIMEMYQVHRIQSVRESIVKLINNINTAITDEKNELERQFHQLIASSTPAEKKKEKTSFFRSLFTTSLEQKIGRLKDAGSPNGVDISDELIEDVDLSSTVYLSPGIFNGCIIRDVDLSLSSFERCSFARTFFYNVRMNGTTFYDTKFEQAVFIDVTAENARFNRCSFSGASFLNCNFKSGEMSEAVFAGCNIVKTSFSETDISGATFVSSQITRVSFSDTRLEDTDFSGVTGKFCRFSAHTLSRAETEQADLYSRIIDISHKDLGKELIVISQDQSIMNEIRLLIFSELIQHGKKMFLTRNRYAIITAFDLFQPDQADLFELVPLLLHENIDLYTPSSRNVALAKLVEIEALKTPDGRAAGIQNFDIPNGIAGYLPGSETEKICRKYFEKKYLYKDGMIFIERPFCYVEALFTIGSIGSIAHTTGSDIDYWVCIRENLFDAEKMKMFRMKLDAIEKWAKNEFKTEIHFFIVDIEKARKSDFGTSDSESSGSAQGRLLKEEFYRTMIHVAGKLPFWSTIPVDVSRNYYHDLYIRVCPVPEKGRFLDFGDIHDIPAGEYFGASVWQMFKYLKSPFKSVLKMGLIEKYIYEKDGGRLLLCNAFKKEWMNPSHAFNLTKSDPYYILLSSLVIYYKKINKKHPFAKFVQSCFFSKARISDEKELKKSAFGIKEILIKRCMDEWGWKPSELFRAGDINNWSYEKIFSESVKIKQYMVQTYRQCRRIWISPDISSETESFMTPRDRTVLGRKMVVQFSMDDRSKIDSMLLVSKKGLSSGLSLAYNDDARSEHKWLLMHKWRDKKSNAEKNEILKRSVCIEEAGAWLIHNHLYVAENYIKLLPNPTFVKSNDIKVLFKSMYDFFSDDIEKDVSNDDLCMKSSITSMFISLNFTASRDSRFFTEWSVTYRNSWGEMFCRAFKEPSGLRSSTEVINRIRNDLSLEALPSNFKLFTHSQLKP